MFEVLRTQCSRRTVHNVHSVHGALYVVSILSDTSNKRHFQTPDRVHGYLGVSYIATLPFCAFFSTNDYFVLKKGFYNIVANIFIILRIILASKGLKKYLSYGPRAFMTDIIQNGLLSEIFIQCNNFYNTNVCR